MGATVVALLVREGEAFVGSMGDSRAYLLRSGKLRALTRDHTVTEVLLAEGEITAEEAAVHPMRTALSRFVGMPEPAPPEVNHAALRTGDRLLLCSDGLTSMVPDDVIRDLLVRGATDEETCSALVSAALAAGGRDNVTVVLGEVGARRQGALRS
jgi:protein phosphatase